MIAFLVFPLLATLVVWLAGCRDSSRDPRLTTLVLGLLAVFPLLLLLPKVPLVSVETVPGRVVVEKMASFPWVEALQVIWLAGCAVALAKLALSALGLARWRKRSTLLETLEGGVELRELPGIHGPVAAGVFRPMIFVPREWRMWEESTKETILLHELAHHQRHDPFLRWLASLAMAVHWFNPLVHWVTKRLALQCEQACDQRVLAAGISVGRYAEVLFRLASPKKLGVAGLAMAETSSLEARVKHLLRPTKNRGWITLSALTAVAVTGAAVMTLVGYYVPPSSAGVPDAAEVELRMSADPFPADTP